MSNLMYQKSTFNSKACHYAPLKNDRRSISNKSNIHKNSFEIRPLISPDSDSCSDDEITLHDIRHVKHLKKGPTESHSLRKIKKNNSSTTNGDVSESRNPIDPFQNCEFLNLKIEEGDTLQSIAIKYHCSISDIKRANHIISDQEFYGLKNVKIPVRKYGLLTELLPSVSAEQHQDSTTVKEQSENNVRIINISIGHVGRSPSPQETATFFKRMDEDLVKIMLSTQTQKESLEAATVALTAPQITPLVKDPYNTVDCGIQWNYLLAFVIVLAIVIPAVITVYMYVRPAHAHHQDVYNSSSSHETFNPVGKINMKSSKS